MNRSLLEGFLSILGGRVLRMVVTFVSLPLIVQGLGPGLYGDYGFLISTFSLSMILVSAGVTEGAQKFVAENRGDGWERAVVGYYVRIAATLALVGAAIYAVVTSSGLVADLLGDQFTLYFYLLAAFVVTAQFRSLARRMLLAFGLERYSETLHVANKVIWATLAVTLVWNGYGVVGVLVANLCSSTFVALVGFAIVFRRVPLGGVFESTPREFPKAKLRSFNTLNIGLVLLMMSLYHVDIVMVRTMVGDEATGFYKAALALAEYLWIVPIALESLLLHSTSELWSEEAYERIDALAARLTRYTASFATLLIVGLAALGGRFVPLYFGSEFTATVLPLLLLLPGTLGFALARPIMAIGRGKGNLKPLLLATGGAAGINVVLNATLIPMFGMPGAAVATSIGYGSMLAFHGLAAYHVGFRPFSDFRPARLVANATVTAVVVFALAASIQNDIAALVVVPPVGFLVHAAAALKLGLVDDADIESVTASLPTDRLSRT